MKRLIGIIAALAVVLLAAQAFAAGSCGTPTLYSTSDGGRVIELRISCTSDSSDGSVPDVMITESGQIKYGGFKITDVTTVNPGSSQPTSAGAISIADALGRQLVGTTVGDTISHSTSASGKGYLTIDRGSSQRRVTAPPITVSSGAIGNSKSFVYYIKLEK